LLKDDDIDLQRAAGKFIAEIPGPRITEAIAEQLPALGADAQVVLLTALEARADNAAAPHVAKAVTSNREPVRVAAIKALAVFRGAPHVELLAKASAAGGDTAKAARDSLSKLSGPGVTGALIAVVRSDTDASVRANAIQTLVDRGETDAVRVLFVAAEDSDAGVRRAALRALGALAGQDDLQAMVLMLRATDTDDAVARNAIERALVTIVTRLEDPDAAPIIAGFAGADNMTKHHLLAILPHIGGQNALLAVRAQLRSDNLNIQKDAIRALANWPDPTPLAELIEIAKTDDEVPRQILALRGYIKLLEIPANRGAADTVKMLAEAITVARRPEEKKAVLAALSKYPCQEALDLAKRTGRDRAVAAEADLAAKKIKETLLNRSLKATASRNNGNARRALDGDRGNRWDTGRPMKPGDWFVLDLGLESTIKGLTLDSASSPRDYPRGYEVYVSFDGGSWGKPVITGKGTKPVTEIEFPKPVRARFIKILQTGSSDSWFWSIHELKVELQ
jgi:HEAT repeat protein